MEKWAGYGDGGDKFRWWEGMQRWEGMNRELLALIFVRILPADEMVRTVPFVCKGWWEVVAGPYCWADVDVEAWCRRVNRSDVIDAVVRRLVRRSRGSIRRLSAYRVGNSGFAFAAVSARFLNVLQIPMSGVADQTVEKCAALLSYLTVLDISYCLKITSKGIEMLGKHCKSLVHLRRNMPPPESCPDNNAVAKVEEDEAMAVANSMPKLENLELAYGRFSDHGLNAILTKCIALQILDIRGCWNARVEGDIEQKCNALQSFRYPWHDEYEDYSSSEDGNNCGIV